jgi:hypothetical protein
MVTDTELIFQQINELDAMIEVINQRILELTEKVKERYLVSSSRWQLTKITCLVAFNEVQARRTIS